MESLSFPGEWFSNGCTRFSTRLNADKSRRSRFKKIGRCADYAPVKTSFGGRAAASQYRRRDTLALIAAIVFVVLAIPGWAGAATGLLDKTVDDAVDGAKDATGTATDLVDDTVKDVLDPIKDTTDKVVDDAKDAAEPVTDKVRDPVDPVKDTVDDVTKPVRDAVDEVTNGVDEVIDPVTDTVVPPPGRNTDGGGRVQGDGEGSVRTGVGSQATRRTTAGDRTPSSERDDRADTPARRTRRATTVPGSVQPRTPAQVRAAQSRPAPQSIADAVADASRAFRFPLLVAAVVALFLAIQSRLDGRDPKLAAADEELTFA